MSERKTFYRVGEFYNNHRPGTHCKIIEKVATVENGIAKYRRYEHTSDQTVVIASSLAWTPEEACNLFIAEKQKDVEELTERLEDAKKDLAKAEGLYGRWQKEQEAERRDEERRIKQERDRLNPDTAKERSGLYGDKP